MSDDGRSYVGDIGTEVLIDMKTDISAVLVKMLKVKNKTGEKEWAPTVHESNFLRFVTVDADDFDAIGIYYVQPYMEFAGWKGHGETVTFEIFARWR